jgi:hypothetical protein
MKRTSMLMTLTALLAVSALGLGSPGGPAPPPEKLVVHEWGTFLSVQGSDGVTLGGMVDSEEALPRFVMERTESAQERSQTRWRSSLFVKMETPVTYFYVDKPMIVRMKVDMTKGLLTHWYPLVSEIKPPVKKGELPAPEAGSSLDWGKFYVLPENSFTKEKPRPELPPVGPNETWRFVRDTDSAVVRVRTGQTAPQCDAEKFLFYRGLGAFDLPLQARASGPDKDLDLVLRNRVPEPLTGLVVLKVDNGMLRWARLDDLPGNSTRPVHLESVLSAAQPLAVAIPAAKQIVADTLTASGLFAKEARAMVNNWEHSYFATPGLRVLSVTPRRLVDATIPITVEPKPTELSRVMVGRLEVLTPATERSIAEAIAGLGSVDAKNRATGEARLAALGRLREPVLRRIKAMTSDEGVRSRVERLITEGGAGSR